SMMPKSVSGFRTTSYSKGNRRIIFVLSISARADVDMMPRAKQSSISRPISSGTSMPPALSRRSVIYNGSKLGILPTLTGSAGWRSWKSMAA
ncbi:hypothetical protein ACC740_37025, partial [Rhizobium ruizarguesonis]